MKHKKTNEIQNKTKPKKIKTSKDISVNFPEFLWKLFLRRLNITLIMELIEDDKDFVILKVTRAEFYQIENILPWEDHT